MPYFHLVFTLLHPLNALVAARPRARAQQAPSERWPAGADWARLKLRLYEVAISNERILDIDAEQVAFHVRAGAVTGYR